MKTPVVRSIAGFLFALAVVTPACSKKSSTPTTPTTAPKCTVAPSNLSFGAVVVGAAAQKTFMLSNPGDAALTGTMRVHCEAFALVGDSAYAIAPGGSATMTLRFMPPAGATYACTLDTGSRLCAPLVCSGIGMAPNPQCVVGPAELDFMGVPPFCSRTRTFAVTNVGTGTLSGTVSETCADFTIEGDPTYNLDAGRQKQFTVRYSPTAFGSSVCDIDIGNDLCRSLPLTGEASVFLDTRGCFLTPRSSALDFGDVCVGESVTRTISIRVSQGPGGGTIPLSAVLSCPDIGQPNRATWQVSANPRQFPGLGGATTVTVTFTPTATGESGALVVVSCGDTGPGGALYPRATILITARATQPPGCPTCEVSPLSLEFGNVVVGETKELPITVTNTGVGVLAGSLSEACAQFEASGDYSLGPGESQTLMVRFSPTSIARFGCLTISTGANCPVILAQGTGVAPPSCALSRTVLDFGSVPVGQTKDLTFDLENSGGGTLCGSMSESCADFTVTQNASYCITRPGFVRVTVRFSPSSSGFQQCTIQPGANCPAVTARGTGS